MFGCGQSIRSRCAVALQGQARRIPAARVGIADARAEAAGQGGAPPGVRACGGGSGPRRGAARCGGGGRGAIGGGGACGDQGEGGGHVADELEEGRQAADAEDFHDGRVDVAEDDPTRLGLRELPQARGTRPGRRSPAKLDAVEVDDQFRALAERGGAPRSACGGPGTGAGSSRRQSQNSATRRPSCSRTWTIGLSMGGSVRGLFRSARRSPAPPRGPGVSSPRPIAAIARRAGAARDGRERTLPSGPRPRSHDIGRAADRLGSPRVPTAGIRSSGPIAGPDRPARYDIFWSERTIGVPPPSCGVPSGPAGDSPV